MVIYVVVGGDTLYSISQKYGVSINELASINGITNPDRIVIGEALLVPVDYIFYTVSSGDTLYNIAIRNGVTVNEIVRLNSEITNPSLIYVGQVIRIPTPIYTLGTTDVNGYVYTNIRDEVLSFVLPYLTYISPFSYQARPNGTLVPIPDTQVISEAKAQRVLPVMVMTNIDDSGTFSSELARVILTDSGTQDALISSVISVLNEKGYSGLDIDFEYVYPYNREDYNNFLRKVVDRLRPLGFTVTTALAPKVSGDQVGLLYEAHDYPVHGSIADRVIIMTYEWGYTFGPPLAVAPSNEVERVLQYAVSVIPSEKILMGMPNYGYDWTLPYVRGTRARVLSNIDAVELARDVGANIQYDTRANAPFFYYYDSSGARHIVWFDDVRSVFARLKFIEKYNLGGVSYWTINRPFPQNWVLLNEMYDINKKG